MASQNRIDSIYDVAKITAEQQEVEKLVRASIEQIKQARSQSIDFNVNTKSIADYNAKVNELNASITNMKNTVAATTAATKANTQATQQANGTLEQNIELRRRLQTTLNSYLKDQKEDAALLKSGAISRAEYNKRLTESQAKVAIYKQKIQELNRVVKEDIAVEGRAGDAYKQLSAEYNRAALAAKNYQITLGAENPITIKAVENAKRLSDRLKEVDNAVGQNQRNVGNYANAIQQSFSKAWGFLRTAANVIPGLGISGIFLLLFEGLKKLTSGIVSSNAAFDSGKVSAKAYAETLKKVNEEAVKSAAPDTTKLELYRSILNDVTQSQQNRTQALRAYNAIADDANKIDESQLNNLTLINDKISQQITLIERRALSRAAEAILAEKGEKLLLANLAAREKAEKEVDQELVGIVAGSTERQLELDRQLELSRKVRANTTVAAAQAEFDAAKKALYGLIQVEGFAAEEVKKTREKKEKAGRDLAEANRKAQFEILKTSIELDIEFQKAIVDNEKLSFSERAAALVAYNSRKQQLINVQFDFERGAANLTRTEILKIESDRDAERIRLARETNKELQKIVSGVDTSTGQRPEASGKLPASIQKALKDFEKLQDEAIKKQKDFEKKIKESLVNLAKELEGLFFDIFINQIERQKNAIQDQIDLLDAQKQKEIELADQTITNAQEKADAIAVIEARAQTKKEALERRQRQLDVQKARFEKARAITEIIQSTSLAVVKALAEFPGPAGIALGAVIGAIGAVQLARAIAQPIPKYAEGTDNHPGGLAIVGDGGKSETVVLPDGSLYRTPSKDTLVNMPAGSQVIPDYIGKPQNMALIQPVDNTDRLMQGFEQVVKAVKRIPQPVIRADRAWTEAHRQGSNFRTYLNRYK